MYFTNLYYYKNLFIIELLLAEFLYCLNLKKKEKFILRYAIILSVMIIIGFLLPIFSYDAFSSSVLFLSLFIITIPLLKFCYDESWVNILFCSLASYTTQHLAYEASNLMTSLIRWGESPMVGIYNNSSNNIFTFDTYFILWFLVYIICYVSIYLITYFLFAKKINRGEDMRVKNISLLFLIGCGLLTNIILNMISVYNDTNAVSNVVDCIYNCLCCVLLLYGQFSLLHNKELENELSFVKKLWGQDKQHYELSRENIDLINIKCHDMKHQIRQIGKNKSISEEAIKEIESSISLYDSVIKTGNQVLDVVLTEKSLYCAKNHISLTYMADVTKLDIMNEVDIYALFGNALDNAIEAVLKIADINKRFIELKIHVVGSLLTINVKNSFLGNLVFDENGLPKTTKKDSDYHGYGVKSIKLIVNNYDGNVSFTTKDGIFNLNILIPLNN